MAGPRNGATTANGAMVRISDSATRPRAALGEMSKNNDPASASVTMASPPALIRWARASFENGDDPTGGRSAAPPRTGFWSGRHPVSVATPSWYGPRPGPLPAVVGADLKALARNVDKE